MSKDAHETDGIRQAQVFAHDMFNIIALVVICFFVFIFLVKTFNAELLSILVGHYRFSGGEDLNEVEHIVLGADEMELYYFIFYFFCSYLLIDMIWVIKFPKCVPASPISIVVHHLATFVLLGTSFSYAPVEYAWNTAIYLSVELNTIILVSKRNLRIGSSIWLLLDVLFYTTWILQRLLMFPVLTWWSYYEYLRFSFKYGTLMNGLVLTPFFTLLLAILSYKWTIDMLFKTKKKRT